MLGHAKTNLQDPDWLHKYQAKQTLKQVILPGIKIV